MNNEEFETNDEKRINERSGCKGIIKWSYFNRNNFFDGKLFNFSSNGFYFETSEAIKTGATIFMRLTKYFPENLSSNDKELLRNVCIGEVKHCKEIPKDDFTYYGVGIKFIF